MYEESARLDDGPLLPGKAGVYILCS